jgi:hypothetical protein
MRISLPELGGCLIGAVGVPLELWLSGRAIRQSECTQSPMERDVKIVHKLRFVKPALAIAMAGAILKSIDESTLCVGGSPCYKVALLAPGPSTLSDSGLLP